MNTDKFVVVTVRIFLNSENKTDRPLSPHTLFELAVSIFCYKLLACCFTVMSMGRFKVLYRRVFRHVALMYSSRLEHIPQRGYLRAFMVELMQSHFSTAIHTHQISSCISAMHGGLIRRLWQNAAENCGYICETRSCM